jgi:hypothetical protein
MGATREQIGDAIRKASRDNRLSCEAAHAIGKELTVSLQEIGAVCNELKIKIASCQLGCF